MIHIAAFICIMKVSAFDMDRCMMNKGISMFVMKVPKFGKPRFIFNMEISVLEMKSFMLNIHAPSVIMESQIFLHFVVEGMSGYFVTVVAALDFDLPGKRADRSL